MLHIQISLITSRGTVQEPITHFERKHPRRQEKRVVLEIPLMKQLLQWSHFGKHLLPLPLPKCHRLLILMQYYGKNWRQSQWLQIRGFLLLNICDPQRRIKVSVAGCVMQVLILCMLGYGVQLCDKDGINLWSLACESGCSYFVICPRTWLCAYFGCSGLMM